MNEPICITTIESDWIEDGYYGRCDTCDWDGPQRMLMAEAMSDVETHVKEKHP